MVQKYKPLKTLNDLISSAPKYSRHNYEKWEKIEAGIVDSGKENSLPLYLLNEIHNNYKEVKDIAEEFGVKKSTLYALIKRLNVPLKDPNERIQKIANEYITTDIGIEGIKEKYGGSPTSILKTAVNLGFITQEEYDMRKSQNHNSAAKNRTKLDDLTLLKMVQDYVNNVPIKEMEKKYGVNINYHLAKAMDKGYLNKDLREKCGSERESLNNLDKNSKIPLDQLEILCLDYNDLDLKLSEVAQKHELSESGLNYVLKRAKRNGLIGREQIEKMRDYRKRFKNKNSKTTNEELVAMCQEYLNPENEVSAIAEKYGYFVGSFTEVMQRAKNLGIIKNEQIKEVQDKRRNLYLQKMNNLPVSLETKEKMRLAHQTPEAIQRDIKNGLINGRKARKNKYFVQNRFYADSLQEGATALILEKYFPNYMIQERTNFQVNGDTPCLFDFLVEDKILEWHPTIRKHDKKYLPEDNRALEEICKLADTPSEMKAAKELTKDFINELGVAYWMSRQDASDNSNIYQGREVIVAKTPNELYEFLQNYSKNLPKKKEFRKEFRRNENKVREFKVNKSKNKIKGEAA